MSQTLTIFQFNGCNKCFHQAKLLENKEFQNLYQIESIEKPQDWQEKSLGKAVITGFLLPEDQSILERIVKNAQEVIGFGTCATAGGIFGLNYQRGIQIKPLHDLVPTCTNVNGCLGEVETLYEIIHEKPVSLTKSLCEACVRNSTCDYLADVYRQFDIYEEEAEKCFNDFGFLCNGYIAKDCKEHCIDFGTPCRGCKPSVERSGFRMLGMWGTLMANIEVATEPTGKGGTDKLADDDDDITEKNPDNTGNFFRYTLADSNMPLGKKPSTGNLTNNIFIERPIEELPLIAGSMGGLRSISLTLDIIEAYEYGSSMEISEKVREIRQELRVLENQLVSASNNNQFDDYLSISAKIRRLAGNMNLSNIFYGGFKVVIEGEDNFDAYKYQVFDVKEGQYTHGLVEYTLDSNGIVTKFNWEEQK